MKIFFTLSLLTVLGLGLITGCGQSAKASKSKLLDGITVNLENSGTYKTPKGKPVRVFKIAMNQNLAQKEYLLLVVGDTAAAVTLPDAVTADIGGKLRPLPLLSCPGGNAIFAMSAEDPAKALMIDSLKLGISSSTLMPPMPNQAPSTPKGFPMEKFKAKITGETLNLPELDTL